MAWGALVKTVAKGAVKKTATGAIKKKVKGKGKKMAKKMMDAKKEKDNSSAIVVREKSTALIPIDKASSDGDSSSIQKSESSSSPLERIRSTLLDIIETLKKRRKLVLNKSRKDRVQTDKEKKAKREGLLEKMKSGGKKMLSNVKAAATGWWERLQRFLLMTMLGALVLSIKNNWEAIKAQIEKVVKFVQDLWKFMSPILIPIFKALKWIAIQGFKMIAGIVTTDKKQIEKGIDEASNELESIKKETEGVTKQFKESEKNIKNISNTKEPNLDTKDTKKGEVEGKTAPLPKTNRDEVTTSKNIKGSLTKIEVDGKLVPRGLSGPMETFGGKGGSTYQDEDLKQYEKGAVPVPETGPAVVHKGEVIIPAPIVKKVGGPMNVVNLMELGLPGLGGGGGGTNAITDKAQTKSVGSRTKDIGNLLARPFRDKTKADPRSTFATLSEYLPPIMMEKMEKTLTTIKEQTEYEDPSPSTIIISVPTSSPQSAGGGGSETMVIPVGATPKDTLNRYVNAVIQKALF